MYFHDSVRVSARAVVSSKAFGSRIKELRIAAELTQDDLSERCGMFRSYVSRIETGLANPTLSMMNALAVSLKVPVVELFTPPAKGAKAQRFVTKKPTPSRGRVR